LIFVLDRVIGRRQLSTVFRGGIDTMRIKSFFGIAGLAIVAAFVLAGASALADNGNPPPTLSFFSGGDGANVHWLATSDQPPGDTDNQAIQLQTTTGSNGYAGILVHHVTGIPAAAFPDSSFWNKAPAGPTLGSPRLIVLFQTATGVADGNAELDQNARTTDGWEQVSDVTDYPNSGWDIHSASCPFMYHKMWSVAQSCHMGDTVSAVYLTTDPYGITHLIDDINVDNKTFSSASDNGQGNNDPAGPAATTDPTLLPPLPIPAP
jgi:hypothetical protein